MKRARSASHETAVRDSDNAQSTEETQQTPPISLQEIMSLCDALEDEDSVKIFAAANALQRCVQISMIKT